MELLLVYALFVAVSEVFAVSLALYLDHFLPAYSLPIGLVLILSTFYLAFPAAVIATRRRAARQAASSV